MKVQSALILGHLRRNNARGQLHIMATSGRKNGKTRLMQILWTHYSQVALKGIKTK